MTDLRALTAVLLLLAASSCDNGKKPTPSPASVPGAHLVLKGLRIDVTLTTTERERRATCSRLPGVGEGRGHLLCWPRERFMKLESADALASFDAAFLDRAGKVVDHRALPRGETEGIMPGAEAAYALLVAPGTLKKLDVKVGDAAELSAEIKAAAPEELPRMKIGDATAYVELALTEADKEHGLMFRPRMSADDGMLFVYGSDAIRRFWMGNTLIPLDLAFFTTDGTFVNVNETPMYPNPRFPPANYETSDSKEPAKYVLEMNIGWFKRKGLVDAEGRPKAGLKIGFPPEALRGFKE